MNTNEAEPELEFRQVGNTWLMASHVWKDHRVRLFVVNEETQNTEVADLTTAMARQLRDWLCGHYPL